MERRELLERLREALKSHANLKTIILVLGALTIVSLLSLILIKGSSTEDYAVLYTHLSPDDAGEILAVLQEERIPYKVVGDGSIILVPKDKVYDVRLKLAAKGLPHGKVVGFELFDEPKLGITQFQQNVEYLRALEGELERTIKRLDAVKSVKVNIALPRDSIFVRQEEEPKASVLVELWPGKELTEEQVKAIIFLVSHAVPGLKPENVTVVDNKGRVLSDLVEGKGEESPSRELRVKKQLEREIERKVRSLLARALGGGKVVVSASVEVETGKLRRQKEIYDPDMTAVVSQRKVQEREIGRSETPQGPPGTSSNVPPVIQSSPAAKIVEREKKDVTTNYDVSKTLESTELPIFRIKRITVGVLVDGKYKEVEGEEGKVTRQFIPRSKEELKTYEEIVKSAIGYDPKRGDRVTVASVPFESETEAQFHSAQAAPLYWPYAVAAGAGLLGVAAVAFFLLRRRRGEEIEGAPTPTEELLQEMRAQQQEIAELRIEQDPTYLKVVEVGRSHPELIANVVSKWLRER